MAVMVGVHGIAQQQLGRNLLREPWSLALADGLERSLSRRVDPPPLDVAFYGDVFLPGADGSKAVGDVDWLEALDEQELAELGGAVSEAVPDAPSPDEADTDAGADAAAGTKGFSALPRPVLTLARAVDARFGAAAGVLFLGELRQVRRYLSDPDVKGEVDGRVSAAVDDSCRVLIGHSLGSVVAYEFTRQHPDHRLDLLLTVGSPLGLRMVRDRLPGAAPGVAPERPVGVARWVNVRDPRDVVACAGGLARWWPAVTDESVNNQRDAHSVTRYLAKRQCGDAVAAAVPDLFR
jgi:hypothetical protein